MSARKVVHIPVLPWFRDHNFNGKIIFPAVEIMLLLADVAKSSVSDSSLKNMSRARFLKFIEIPEGAQELSVLVDFENSGDELFVRLLSKVQLKKMSRIREHAELCFSVNPQELTPVKEMDKKETDSSIAAARIYQELVPFGPAYCTITGTLYLSQSMARATLQAPTMPKMQEMEARLGSPFPLDGAMHAACVLGQCLTDFVPFPVGFEQRCIHRKTRAGEQYSSTVVVRSKTEEELLFDLSIFNGEGDACETVKGLRMRDVSAGTIKAAADLPRLAAFP
jgi:hypothetical protein